MFLSAIRRRIRNHIRVFNKYTHPLFPRPYFQATCLLNLIALINFYSIATSHELISQILIFIVGVGLSLVIANTNYEIIKQLSIPIYLFVCGLLLLVPFIGIHLNGAQRWIRLFGLTIQPSELCKLSIILIIGYYLQYRLKPNTRKEKEYGLVDLLFPLILTLIPTILILKEPDLGTAIICLMIIGSILLFVGIKRFTLITIIMSLCVVGFISWKHLKSYQRDRVLSFIVSTDDYTGKTWQAHQSLIAFGSGGWFGKGIKSGPITQLGYLPERQSDFALASLGEEHGFVAIGLVLLLVGFISISLIDVARSVHNRFSTAVVIGIMFWISLQAIINICMIMNLLPVVGITFPFISHGGSSLLSLMIALGIVASIENNRNCLII